MQEDHQEHLQQMIEILEKISDQVQKVENMHSESITVLDREYPTPPASQTRIATPGKLSAPQNLSTCSGQDQCQVQKGQ